MTDLRSRHQAALGAGVPLFYDEPITVVRGEGVWLYDEAGAPYLDLYNNVPCVGHGNPRVAEAVAQQMATLNVHSRYLHEGVVAYAERLTALLAPGLESLVFTCSGTEANAVAVHAARVATGNAGVIVTDATYHGNLGEIRQMSSLPVGVARGSIRSFPTPDSFRPGGDPLEGIAAAIEALKASGHGVAALMVCPIFANEGLPDPPDGFLGDATAMVRSAGGVLIADEVQAGFGRTGRWWGYETAGITPDIVTVGKPMGNGVPVAAAIASHETISALRRGFRYFNTFAASPVQAAAANAVLDEIESRSLLENASTVGAALRDALVAFDDPRIGEVRAHGLFIGVDWVHPGTTEPDRPGAKAMVEALKARRMLIGTDGAHDNVLKIRPPLVFGLDHADLFLGAFEEALGSV